MASMRPRVTSPGMRIHDRKTAPALHLLMRPEDPEMKQDGTNKQRLRCPMAAFKAESAHKRKKAVGVGVTH